MSRPKDIGTRAETAVVRYLAPNGFGVAERRALRGHADAGDITGTPGVCWSVKGGKAATNASDGQIAEWLVDLQTQVIHADAAVGVLVLQRRAVGPANAGRWWAVMVARDLVALTTDHGYPAPVLAEIPLRMTLRDAAALLRLGGYGDPITDREDCA